MRVVIALNNSNSAQKLLYCLNESVEAVILLENVDKENLIELNGRRYPVLPYRRLNEVTGNFNWDYFLTSRNGIAGRIFSSKIDPAKLIYVDGIIEEDHIRQSILMYCLEKSITDFEMVAVGNFAALMGFSTEDFPVKTVNLSLTNQDIWLSYQWLKKVLSIPENKIKYALIGLAPYSFRYNLSKSADKWEILAYYSFFQNVHNLPLDNEKLTALFNDRFLKAHDFVKDELVKKNQIPKINFSDPFTVKQKNNRPLMQQDLFGVRANARQWGAEKYEDSVQENEKIFVECLKLCKAHNVTPIVVKFPVHSFYKYLFPQHISDEFNLIIHKAKKVAPFKFIDCYNWNLQDGREFCRIDALNTIGAKRITAKINPLIEKLKANKILVGFICQGGKLDKLEPVYQAMRKRDNVEIILLVVPPYENYDLGKPFNPKDERYIKAQQDVSKNYGNDKNVTITKILTDEGFMDIENLNLDYLFYKRPYEAVLPPNVRCQVTSQFTKTCYVPYGVSVTDFGPVYALNNIDFFNTLNFLFADVKQLADRGRNQYHTGAENSNQNFLFLGSPEMEDFFKHFSAEFESNLNKDRKSVLWAPRWAYGSIMGGSHFMEYKDGFIALRKKYPDLALNVRPHPLLFPRMIQDKRMTENDVEFYKETLRNNDIYLDESETLPSIFKKSDIMIADLTSIISLYIMTGNPIIYCPCTHKLFDYFDSVVYTANSWDEVEKYLAMLLSGEDPLRDKRRQLIEELHKTHNGAAERIVQTIIDDYNKTNLKYD